MYNHNTALIVIQYIVNIVPVKQFILLAKR